MAESGEEVKNIIRPPRRKTEAGDLSSFVFGKVQPQARDLEEAVLGAMMLEKDAVSLVIDILKPESFYVSAHQSIFKSIGNLFNRSQPVDILTVTEELRKMGELENVGGAFYVSELTNRVASAANVEYHARIISQKFIQRELIRISTEVIKDSYEDTTDVLELLDKAEQNIYNITEKNLRRNYSPLSTLVTKAINQLKKIESDELGLRGVPSGFNALDRLTSGWQNSDLIIVAARPGMGKTSFVLSLARNAAMDFKRPVAFFSLEMSDIQLTSRLLSAESQLPAEKLRAGKLERHEWEQLNSKIDSISEAPLFIDDTPALNIFELRAKCRRLKMQHNIQLIIIDYLQLMSGGGSEKGGNREQEISTISRSLKSIAKELDVPVIALSQLSRAVETRGGDKKPQLSDLRESGAIEQDADMVMFIWRPEYYKIDVDADGRPLKGIAELIIAKHRNGALANVQVKFIDRFAKFENLEYGEFISMGESSANAMTQSGNTSRYTPDYKSNEEGNIQIIRSKKWDDNPGNDEETPF
jgi:replicative DNA helicase